MKKFLSALLALMVTVSIVGADSYPVGRVSSTLAFNHDIASAGYTYVVFGDLNAALAPVNGDGTTGYLGPGTIVNKRIKTTGSTTTTVCAASGECFRGLAAGDLLLTNAPDQSATTFGILREYERSITTFTDSNNVVVNAAWDLTTTGVTFRVKRKLSGTAATDAWFSVEGLETINVQFDLTSFNATNDIVTLECRVDKFAAANTLFTSTFTATGSTAIGVNLRSAPQEQCRVGAKITGDTGANNLNIYFMGIK